MCRDGASIVFIINPSTGGQRRFAVSGKIEGNTPASDNDWETITGGGDKKIKEWIANQLKGRTCTVILAGSNTANRKRINYDISESWNKGMGVVVIHIYNITTDSNDKQNSKGANPLYYITFNKSGNRLSTVAKAYDPPRTTRKRVYNFIADNIENWVEEAIRMRNSQ